MKRTLAMLMALALAVLMFGCSSPESGSSASTETSAETSTEASEEATEAPSAEATEEATEAPSESAEASEESSSGSSAYTFDAETSGQNPEKDNYYFVFVSKVVHPYYDQIEKGVEAAIADYESKGIKITWDWDSPSEVDPVQQIEKLEAAAAKNPDAVAVVVSDPSVVDPVIKEVIDQGVPVVTLSEDSDANDRVAFVGRTDFYQEGKDIAEALAKKIDYKGKVGLLVGSVTSVAHYQRTDAIKDVLEQYPDIEIVSEQADNDNLESAVSLAEQMINAYPDLDAIISSDGSAHAGAAQAVSDAGKAGDIVLVGFDAISETVQGIENDTIYTSLAANCYQMGYWVVQVMIDIADQKAEGVIDDIQVDMYLLTKENLADYIDYVG